MSTAAMPQSEFALSLEDVQDDAIQGLIEQGFKRNQAEAAVHGVSGSTFSEIFKAALEWLSDARAKGRPVQAQTAKPNGHAPTVVAEKRCAGFERECTEILGKLNRTGLCSTCYARKNYTENYSAAARGKKTASKGKAAKPAKQAASKIIDAPPVAARVALEVTEPQLNQFLVRLSLEDKQRLANYFLQTAEV